MRIKIVQKPNVKRIDGVRVEPVDQFVPDGVESQPANLIRETYPAYDDDPTALAMGGHRLSRTTRSL